MLSNKGLSDFQCLLDCISNFKDSVFEIREVKNTSGESYAGGGQYKYPQKDMIEIIFIFREFYARLPRYATVRLEYVNGEIRFICEKNCLDGTELQSAFIYDSTNKENMQEKFNLLYKTVKEGAEKIISDFDSISF